MHYHQLFDEKSDLYASSRPVYPDQLFAYLAGLCPATRQAWDCATGTGQAASSLAKWFDHVVATDVSAQQILNAAANPKITYAVQHAEQTDFSNQCFDLVTVAQALHWFDYAKFWPEVDRVLRPGGLFAAWGYSWSTVMPAIDAVMAATVLRPIQPYWATQNQLLWDGYQQVPFPYQRLNAPHFQLKMDWSLHQLFSYMHTWSATRRCMDAIGDQFFHDAFERVASVWGAPEQQRPVRMDLVLLVGRKPLAAGDVAAFVGQQVRLQKD